MADKKVERSRKGHPLTPSERLVESLSDQGVVDMADPRHDKGKSALVDKFRGREERWRRDQAVKAREGAPLVEATPQAPEEVSSSGEPLEGGEGGAK